MGANWKTNLFGALLGMGTLIHGAGISVGHIGSVDVVQAVSGVAALLLGFYAKDKNVSGGTVANDVTGSVPVVEK